MLLSFLFVLGELRYMYILNIRSLIYLYITIFSLSFLKFLPGNTIIIKLNS
ncbi:hypothetical protein BN1326_60220 [Staphylococcus argenteus]|uniref:Uncharacterized protein n=1 Tax=Staphylococcus argenteus TaxID=985002 RepID=A0A7U7JTX6_9STAP|nr:hypothetical protein BN1326_60220 [Staphylococcus argenteus]CRI26033.1 hypothetical protein BN1326_60220 [Staphylococcus argenteus]